METLLNQLNGLEHWQIASVATVMLLQGMVLAIFPEEIVFTTLGLLWGEGKIGFFEAWLAILLGLLPANSMPAFFGRKFGLRALSARPMSWVFKKEAVEAALVLLKRHGSWIVFLTRFIPIIRGPIYFATGVSQMSAFRFFKTDALASLIQVPLLLFIGKWIGKNADSLMQAYQRIGLFMLGLIVGVIVIRWIAKRLQPHQIEPSI
jgi:membrane protein DedA with SNARE-associated domain